MDEKKDILTDRIIKTTNNIDLIKKDLAEGRTAQEILEIPQEEFNSYLAVAEFFLKDERYSDATDVLLFLVTLNPHYTNAWILLGLSLKGGEFFEEAIDALEMAAFCALEDPRPYLYLGSCLFAIHERETALEALEMAIEYSEGFSEWEDVYKEAVKAKERLEGYF